MFRKQVRLANTLIRVDSTMDMVWGATLALFEAEGCPHVTVSVRYAEQGEEVGYRRVIENGDAFLIVIPEGVYARLSLWHILSMLPMERILMNRGTMILHASYVFHNGQAILFSGPSGIGKSTQGGLWEAAGEGTVINGDRVLLTPTEHGVQVDSHYLSGTSGICSNMTASLKSIVLLAKEQSNTICIPSALERFKQIICQLSYYPDDPRQRFRVMELTEALLSKADVISYTCRKDESAVFCLKDYLFS
jgi:hypothetical protein